MAYAYSLGHQRQRIDLCTEADIKHRQVRQNKRLPARSRALAAPDNTRHIRPKEGKHFR